MKENRYYWKVLDKTVVRETYFRDGCAIYTVENIDTHEREKLEVEDTTFIKGDIVCCINPNAVCPDPELVNEELK